MDHRYSFTTMAEGIIVPVFLSEQRSIEHRA
jgi:hypothetical protein